MGRRQAYLGLSLESAAVAVDHAGGEDLVHAHQEGHDTFTGRVVPEGDEPPLAKTGERRRIAQCRPEASCQGVVEIEGGRGVAGAPELCRPLHGQRSVFSPGGAAT